MGLLSAVFVAVLLATALALWLAEEVVARTPEMPMLQLALRAAYMAGSAWLVVIGAVLLTLETP